MKKIKAILFTAILATASTALADVAGSGDHPLIKRYKGSEIIYYKKIDFDVTNFCTFAEPKPGAPELSARDKAKSGVVQEIGGAITSIAYGLVAEGISQKALFYNYEHALQEAGWTITFKSEEAGDHCLPKGEQVKEATRVSGFPAYGTGFGYRDRQLHVKRQGSNGDIYATIVWDDELSVSLKKNEQKMGPEKRYSILVTIIEPKPVEIKMELITAKEMAKSLQEQGKVDLYGILFDTDKTLIKPESEPTLKEVAQLLQDDTALKLSIIGHTDNVGTKEYNDKLSQGRAQAVVGWLMLNGVDMTRLKPLGRGFDEPVAPNDTEEGRAKNRRVELRKAA